MKEEFIYTNNCFNDFGSNSVDFESLKEVVILADKAIKEGSWKDLYLTSEADYDGCYRFELRGWRRESDQEHKDRIYKQAKIAERAAQKANNARSKIEIERKLYEKLKKKFESE